LRFTASESIHSALELGEQRRRERCLVEQQRLAPLIEKEARVTQRQLSRGEVIQLQRAMRSGADDQRGLPHLPRPLQDLDGVHASAWWQG
jgi:hypothetical protein